MLNAVNPETASKTPLLTNIWFNSFGLGKNHCAPTYLAAKAAGADPNLTDANGATALHYAVLFNNQELAILLMEAGASAFMKNNVGQSPLDFAKMHNDKILNTILYK